VYPLLKTV